jgi:hypothetical protein
MAGAAEPLHGRGGCRVRSVIAGVRLNRCKPLKRLAGRGNARRPRFCRRRGRAHTGTLQDPPAGAEAAALTPAGLPVASTLAAPITSARSNHSRTMACARARPEWFGCQ